MSIAFCTSSMLAERLALLSSSSTCSRRSSMVVIVNSLPWSDGYKGLWSFELVGRRSAGSEWLCSDQQSSLPLSMAVVLAGWSWR
jgi:hypothetical protein